MTEPTPATRAFVRFSLKWGMIEEPELSILDKFLLLRDLGFDGVELDAPDDLPTAEILAASARSGVLIPGVVNSMHWKTPLTHPDPDVRRACIASIRTALDNARAYGSTTMLLVPGIVDATTSYLRAWDLARAGLTQVLDHAEATGVSIAIENVWNAFLLSPLEAARFVDGFGHKRVGWYFDVGNVVRYGRPAHWIEALGSRILKVDIKEFNLKRMDSLGPRAGFDVELGDGDCDWAEVNRALLAVGYSGWASAEVPGGNRTRLAAIREWLSRIAAL
jgi:L-ribulose-5-phosphate 3-epimerase